MLRTAHAGYGLLIATTLLAVSTSEAQVTPNPYRPASTSAAGPASTNSVSTPTTRPAQASSATRSAVPLQSLEQALVVEAGATCLDASKLVERVARWLQRDSIDARVHVHVRGDNTRKNGVSFSIERGGGDRAERAIPDAPEDCDQFHSALALSIALAIDASLGGRGSHVVEVPPDEELLAKPSKPEPPYFRLALGLLGHATAGLLTDTSFAGSARVELGFVRWLDLRAGVLGTQLDNQPLRPAGVDGTFYVSLGGVRVDACGAQVVAEAFRVLACAGGVAGPLRTRGHSFSREDTQSRLWSAAVSGVEAQASVLPWLALTGTVDVVVPFAKHRIQALDSRDQVVGERQIKGIAVLVGAGIVFRVL